MRLATCCEDQNIEIHLVLEMLVFAESTTACWWRGFVPILMVVCWPWYPCLSQTFDRGLFSDAFKAAFSIERYDANNGLPQNEITDVVQDESGFVWLGTQGGLVRWDGRDFMTFHSRNSPLCYERIFKIDRDVFSDQLMVRDARGCKLYIERGDLRVIEDSKIINSISWTSQGVFRSHVETDTGLIAVPVLAEIITNTGYPGPYNAIAMDSVHWLQIEGSRATIWNLDTILARIDLPSPIRSDLSFSYGAYFYLIAADRVIYQVDTSGIVSRNEVLQQRLRDLPAGQLRHHTGSTRQRLPILSYGDMFFEISHVEGKMGLVDLFEGVRSAAIVQVHRLSRHMFILTTRNEGFAKISRKLLRGLYYEDLSSDQITYSQVEISPGKILTHRNILYDVSGESPPVQLPSEEFWYLNEARSGTIYGRTAGHLYIVDSSLTRHLLPLNPNRMSVFAVDDEQNIWTLYAGVNPRLGFFDKDMIFHPVAGQPELLLEELNFIEVDEAGKLWFCRGRGIFVYDTKKLNYWSLDELEGADIRDLKFDANGDVWICTYNRGFFRYREGELYQFPLDRSEFLINAHYILEDSLHFFWIPTNKGLFRFHRKELEDLADGVSDKFFYQYFDASSGLVTDEFNGGAGTGLELSNGDFSMASMKGIVVFNPYEMPVPDNASPFWLRVQADSKTVEEGDLVPTKHDELHIELAAPAYEEQEIYYRLLGLSEEWRLLESSDLTFFRLPGGNYTLQLKKYAGFGGDREIRATFGFSVQHAFFDRTWVRISAFMLVLLLAYGIHRVRMRYLTKMNTRLAGLVDERSRDLKQSNTELTSKIEELNLTQSRLEELNRLQEHVLSMVSHDIRGSLNFISFVSGESFASFEADTEKLRDNHGVIKRTSDSMVRFVEQLLSYLKSSQGVDDINAQLFSVRKLIEETIAILEPRLREKEIKVKHLPGEINLRSQRPFFGSIVHNILENEIKHGNRNIEIKYQDNKAVIICGDQDINADRLNAFLRSDSFFYYNQRTNKASLGLAIMKNLSEKLDLTMEYQSLKPSGHAVRIKTTAIEPEVVASGS